MVFRGMALHAVVAHGCSQAWQHSTWQRCVWAGDERTHDRNEPGWPRCQGAPPHCRCCPEQHATRAFASVLAVLPSASVGSYVSLPSFWTHQKIILSALGSSIHLDILLTVKLAPCVWHCRMPRADCSCAKAAGAASLIFRTHECPSIP